MNRSHAAFVSLLLCSISVQAQTHYSDEDLDALYAEEKTISIATGTNQPVHLAPSVASVVTAQDIRSLGASELDQVLELLPGIHVGKSFNRLNSIYSVRGIHTTQNPQMLLLLNGARIQQLFSGGRPTLFRMPVENIKQIEVIRGPGSAVYGADAFAGVINVITKDAVDIDGTVAGLRGGSFATRDLWLQHGSLIEGWNLSFSTQYSESDGDDDRVVDVDFQRQLDEQFFAALPASGQAPDALSTRYKTLNSHLRAENERWDIALYSWLQRDAGVGAGGLQALDDQGRVDTDYFQFNSHYRWSAHDNVAMDLNLRTALGSEETEYVLQPPGSGTLIGTDGNLFTGLTPVIFTDGVIGQPSAREKSYGAELTSYFNGIAGHLWRTSMGIEIHKGDAWERKNYGPGILDNATALQTIGGQLTDVSNTANNYVRYTDRRVRYFSVQDEWRFDEDWILTGGVRYDHYSDFGDTVNPRAALVWSSSYNLTSKLMYGRAFRAPSVAERFVMNNPAILGNPDLDPETIDTLELAFDHHINVDLKVQYNIFAYRIQDLIDYVPQGSAWVADNARELEGHGAEFDMHWQLTPVLALSGNFSWQRSEDTETDMAVADAPGRQLTVNANWQPLTNWLASIQLNRVMDRERVAADSREAIEDYTRVDLSVRRKRFLQNWELALIVGNLFDTDYAEPSAGPRESIVAIPGDYPMEGRQILAELRYHLSP